MRPIHRIKHVIDTSAGNLVAGTNVNIVLVKGVVAPDANSVQSEVEVGSKVNALYLRVEVSGDENVTGQIPNCYMIVHRNPGGSVSAIAPNAVGSNLNKRYVIHQEMLMLQGESAGNPRTLFNGVISIPKGFRRFADTDQIQLRILAPTININYCVQCIYKEFR